MPGTCNLIPDATIDKARCLPLFWPDTGTRQTLPSSEQKGLFLFFPEKLEEHPTFAVPA